MSSVSSFTIALETLNPDGTFSQGDSLTGNVSLVLGKETKIKSLFIKVKGDANVRWSKKRGDHTYTYSAHRRYFKLKEFFIPNDSELVLPEGVHVYKFNMKIPTGCMPSSFKGYYGKIVYKLEAKLSRSWRMDSLAEREFTFISKSFPNLPSLMSQQVGSTNKELGVFSKGHVNMDVTIDKTAYVPGETVTITANINNSSSKEMALKFKLNKEMVYRAQGDTRNETDPVFKVVENTIKPNTQESVKCTLQIPNDLGPTIQNCEIISLEYRLKAYLDISFSYDPEIEFPIIILPQGFYQNGTPGHYNFGPGNSDFPHPAPTMSPYPLPPQSGGYPQVQPNYPPGYPGPPGYPQVPGGVAYPPAQPNNPPGYAGPPGVYPPQPTHMSGVYNNPAPQMPSPYSSPFSSTSSTSVLHPPPSGLPTLPSNHYPPAPNPNMMPSAPSPNVMPSAPSPNVMPSAPSPNMMPSAPSPNMMPSAPSPNMMPSAPMMDMKMDFLSQTDDKPPTYSMLYPSSTDEKSDVK